VEGKSICMVVDDQQWSKAQQLSSGELQTTCINIVCNATIMNLKHRNHYNKLQLGDKLLTYEQTKHVWKIKI